MTDSLLAQETIRAAYFMLNELTQQLTKPISPIEAAIDKATGFDKTCMRKNLSDSIDLIETIIYNKRVLEMDTMKDQGLLLILQSKLDRLNTVIAQ